MRQASNNIDSLSGSLLPDEKEQCRSEKKNIKMYIYTHIPTAPSLELSDLALLVSN